MANEADDVYRRPAKVNVNNAVENKVDGEVDEHEKVCDVNGGHVEIVDGARCFRFKDVDAEEAEHPGGSDKHDEHEDESD